MGSWVKYRLCCVATINCTVTIGTTNQLFASCPCSASVVYMEASARKTFVRCLAVHNKEPLKNVERTIQGELSVILTGKVLVVSRRVRHRCRIANFSDPIHKHPGGSAF